MSTTLTTTNTITTSQIDDDLNNSAQLINGKAIAEEIRIQLEQRVKKLSTTTTNTDTEYQNLIIPHLAIIQVGSRSDSSAYIRAKTTFAHSTGLKSSHIHLPNTTTQDEV